MRGEQPSVDKVSHQFMVEVTKTKREITMKKAQSLGAIALGASLIFIAGAAEADRIQGRSMIVSEDGIAATEHPLASQAAAAIMADGGNAIDAAIAANAMMGLVFPAMNGIGGDVFAIVYEAETGELHGLQSHGWAPEGLSIEYL